AASNILDSEIKTEFTGYTTMRQDATIVAILIDDQSVESVNAGQECWIITDKSPLYVACGGQINDTASIVINNVTMPVLDLKKMGDAIGAQVVATTAIATGQKATIIVDEFIRLQTMKNHTAT